MPGVGVVTGKVLVLIELLVVFEVEVDWWGTLEGGWVEDVTG